MEPAGKGVGMMGVGNRARQSQRAALKRVRERLRYFSLGKVSNLVKAIQA